MYQELSSDVIAQIFAHVGLGKVHRIQKIAIGFSNDVYAVDEQYVLKAGKSQVGEPSLLKEIYLCSLLRDRVPAPEIIFSDTSKALLDRTFIIYRRIPGQNLYSRWHLFSDDERRDVIGQICGILRSINETPYEAFAREFGVDLNVTWQQRVYGLINERLAQIETQNTLTPEIIAATRRFLRQNEPVLHSQNMALTYWDAHFDNFIVLGNQVVGVLDFDLVSVASIDYVLDLVYRMVRQPRKYASEQSESLVKAEHYSKLMDWYREFYPELFDFEKLEQRLDFYSLLSSLNDIFCYPQGQAARQELVRCIG